MATSEKANEVVAKLIINGEFRSSSICMKVIEYYVLIKSVSIIDANNLDKKMFVNNIPNLLISSLINFNIFLL